MVGDGRQKQSQGKEKSENTNTIIFDLRPRNCDSCPNNFELCLTRFQSQNFDFRQQIRLSGSESVSDVVRVVRATQNEIKL